jgi:hypothetical protein
MVQAAWGRSGHRPQAHLNKGGNVARKKVDIYVLTTGWVRWEVFMWLFECLMDSRYEVTVGFAQASPVANNRNHISKEFREGPRQSDVLVMWDSDVIPPRNPLDLVEFDFDIVGLPAPIWKAKRSPLDPIVWNLLLVDEEGKPTVGELKGGSAKFGPVAEMGAGITLIARRVLEHPDMRAPFLELYDEDGLKVMGEDIRFFRRVRTAGFEPWAAADYQCSHIRELDLKTVYKLTRKAQQATDRPLLAPGQVLADKHLIFCISPGRSGTAYLAEVMKSVDGVASFHEGEPDFAHVLRMVQHHPGVAYKFWTSEKLPFISTVEESVYFESSHLFGKGFAEPLLDLDIIPDIVVLRRPHREVALSMWRRQAIPGRGELGNRYHIIPSDPTALLSLPGYREVTEYQLCYWYCLEMEARAERYTKMFKNRGARVVETSLKEVTTQRGFLRVVEELGLPAPDYKRYKELDRVVNPNPVHLREGPPEGDLDEQEKEIEMLTRTVVVSERSNRVGRNT